MKNFRISVTQNCENLNMYKLENWGTQKLEGLDTSRKLEIDLF